MSPIEIEVMAHRYLYYVKSAPVITDAEYDGLEAYARKVTPGYSPIHQPGSDLERSYVPLVRERARELQKIFT